MMSWRRFASGVLITALVQSVGTGQTARRASSQEQSRFNCEQGFAGEPIQRPISLPEGALRVLAYDDGVSSCLENENMTRDQLPASWFVASEIHLDGPDEVDLVVLPNLDTGLAQNLRRPAGCFLGANTAEFWIVRKTSQQYELVLHAGGHDLEVSKIRTNGLRDAMTITPQEAGRKVTTVIYTFDGKRYKPRRTLVERVEAQP